MATSLMHTVGIVLLTWHRPWVQSNVWDLGHRIIPFWSSAARLADYLTVFSPAISMLCVPTRVRRGVFAFGIRLWSRLWILRVPCLLVTMFPPLNPGKPNSNFGFLTVLKHLALGTDYETIFSGHAAVVAASLLAARPYLPWTILASIGTLHTGLILSARNHYTVDILVAWMLALLLWWNDQRCICTRCLQIPA